MEDEGRSGGCGGAEDAGVRACFLLSNLFVISTHTDTLLMGLQSVGGGVVSNTRWNTALNLFFFVF